MPVRQVEFYHWPVPVIGSTTDDPDPKVIVGPNLQSPLGPGVAVGVGIPDPEGSGFSLIAHLQPETALELAERLRDAAAEILLARKEARGASVQ